MIQQLAGLCYVAPFVSRLAGLTIARQTAAAAVHPERPQQDAQRRG